MKLYHSIKRLFIWLKRFRYRKGYGVHSPFAFNFITHVVYQKSPYYNYSLLEELPKDIYESEKMREFLFRLTNYIQPNSIYYKTDKDSIFPLFNWVKSDVVVCDNLSADLIYLSLGSNADLINKELTKLNKFTTKSTVLVIYGIGYNKEMKSLWQSLIRDPKSGISFDLYDYGVLFFDLSKNKEDYIVNF